MSHFPPTAYLKFACMIPNACETLVTLRILLCMVVIFGFGCGVSSTNELNGVYSVRYAHGSETLTLNDDGTFDQVYTQVEDGHSTTNSGTWVFKKERGDILLRDVFVFDDNDKRRQKLNKAVWTIKIAKRFGKISLIIGEEGVLEYDKTK